MSFAKCSFKNHHQNQSPCSELCHLWFLRQTYNKRLQINTLNGTTSWHGALFALLIDPEEDQLVLPMTIEVTKSIKRVSELKEKRHYILDW